MEAGTNWGCRIDNKGGPTLKRDGGNSGNIQSTSLFFLSASQKKSLGFSNNYLFFSIFFTAFTAFFQKSSSVFFFPFSSLQEEQKSPKMTLSLRTKLKKNKELTLIFLKSQFYYGIHFRKVCQKEWHTFFERILSKRNFEWDLEMRTYSVFFILTTIHKKKEMLQK